MTKQTGKKIGGRRKVVPFERNHEFFFNVAVKRAFAKDFAGALRYVDEAIGLDPYNSDYLFNKACILVELKRTRESIKLLNYIICKIDPTFTECYFGLGCNYFETGDFTRALHYFEKYVMLEEEGEFHDEAVDILLHMRLPEELDAMEEADMPPGIDEEAQKRCRDSALKLHAVGSMYFSRGNYKEAIRQFERSIMEYPEMSGSRIRLSMAYYMTGQLPLAKLLATSVLKMQKGNKTAKLCLALYYCVDGQHDMSERLLGIFTRMRSKRVLGAQDSEDGAFFERMLKIAPVGDEYRNKLAGAAQKLYTPM